MTEYKAVCSSYNRDTITARCDGDAVELSARFSDTYAGETFLAPNAARTFARGILALADEIDGGEAEAPTLRRIPQVGDRVRVVRAFAFEHYTGREGILTSTTATFRAHAGDLHPFVVQFPDGGDLYVAEVEYVEDESADTRPKVGDRLRVTEDATPSTFARYVDEAKRLLAGTTHTGADVIALAQGLADRS